MLMKKVIVIVAIVVCFIFGTITSSAIMEKSTRKQELNKAVKHAMELSFKDLTETREINSNDELVADFMQNLFVELDCDLDSVTIKVISVDIGRKILDVEVTQNFKYTGINKKSSIYVRKSMIEDEKDK